MPLLPAVRRSPAATQPSSTGPVRVVPADARRFVTVLKTHEVELYRYLRRLSPTAEDAADLHQETFLRAFRAYPRLPAGANVRAWLYRIAGNLARDAHRRRVARGDVHDGLDLATTVVAPRRTDPEAVLAATELRDRVQEGLLVLSSRQRVAVTARVLDGMEYAVVAALLDCTETTARQHVSQGLRRLRALLADVEEA